MKRIEDIDRDKDCKICDGEGWVCEDHPKKAWEGTAINNVCECGGAGMPCECATV